MVMVYWIKTFLFEFGKITKFSEVLGPADYDKVTKTIKNDTSPDPDSSGTQTRFLISRIGLNRFLFFK